MKSFRNALFFVFTMLAGIVLIGASKSALFETPLDPALHQVRMIAVACIVLVLVALAGFAIVISLYHNASCQYVYKTVQPDAPEYAEIMEIRGKVLPDYSADPVAQVVYLPSAVTVTYVGYRNDDWYRIDSE